MDRQKLKLLNPNSKNIFKLKGFNQAHKASKAIEVPPKSKDNNI